MDEAFYEHGKRRGRDERAVLEWAVSTLGELCTERDVDLEALLEYSRRSRQSLPDRHLAAYDGMKEVLDVDDALYEVYVFAFSELCDELGNTAANGCTNVLVAPPHTDADGSLVLKNRDIAGRGVRPKAVYQQPAIGDYRGFLTVDTCGTVMLFKGVNDRGLVAANTNIDVERDDVEPEERVRNGTVIRILLEECATVADARTVLESYPVRRLAAQTLFLADETDTVLLEVDPVEERITADDGPLVVRTNHFVNSSSPEAESSLRRRERALALLEGDDRIGRDRLWTVARDHENGPGDDSICRHREPDTEAPYAFEQLTTASATVFEGGSQTIELALNTPCETEPVSCAIGEEIPEPLRTGAQWLERSAVSTDLDLTPKAE
ncbi:C45 family autoproteolytic acyltransferase/hydolase [Natrononativus amylolyticus]|uniref:C45 family autoproteolytic acyltransferase/hydolase n=1 Tax=Natrononativus amylolyticus TaxID=2963434 RepID=UPI0020CE8998|nr:C45 family peptidase [Natrononativus amylolyticus]